MGEVKLYYCKEDREKERAKYSVNPRPVKLLRGHQGESTTDAPLEHSECDQISKKLY